MDTLTVIQEKHPEGLVVALVGSASARNVDALAIKLNGIVAGRPKLLVLDLSKLEFMASLAMGQLVAAQRAVALHHGKVAIAGCTEVVRGALAHARLTTLFIMVDSVEQGLALNAASSDSAHA